MTIEFIYQLIYVNQISLVKKHSLLYQGNYIIYPHGKSASIKKNRSLLPSKLSVELMKKLIKN